MNLFYYVGQLTEDFLGGAVNFISFWAQELMMAAVFIGLFGGVVGGFGYAIYTQERTVTRKEIVELRRRSTCHDREVMAALEKAQTDGVRFRGAWLAPIEKRCSASELIEQVSK